MISLTPAPELGSDSAEEAAWPFVPLGSQYGTDNKNKAHVGAVAVSQYRWNPDF